jgi:putative SOS response-associated peptidase YedK
MIDWTELLGQWPEEVLESDNISPTQLIATFTSEGGAAMRWGMIPNWSREVSNKYATFNARIESVASKPTFKHAWNNTQRCIVPALGYYEWRTEAGAKQPYFIHAESPLLMAGLYEPARGDDIPASCTILTKAANPLLSELHTRMPVMLEVEGIGQWFNGDEETSLAIANADPDLSIRYHAVSKKVNNSRNQGPDLIEAIELGAA